MFNSTTCSSFKFQTLSQKHSKNKKQDNFTSINNPIALKYSRHKNLSYITKTISWLQSQVTKPTHKNSIFNYIETNITRMKQSLSLISHPIPLQVLNTQTWKHQKHCKSCDTQNNKITYNTNWYDKEGHIRRKSFWPNFLIHLNFPKGRHIEETYSASANVNFVTLQHLVTAKCYWYLTILFELILA